MKSSAAYVGRVGGLAVALGIGTAVATGQGVAFADSQAHVSGPTSKDPSSSESKTPDAGPPADRADTTASGEGVRSESSPSPVRHRPVLAGRGIVHISGGAHTSSNPSASVDTTTFDDPSALAPSSDDEGTDSSTPSSLSARHSRTTSQKPRQAGSKPVPAAAAPSLSTSTSDTASRVGQLAVDTSTSTAVDTTKVLAGKSPQSRANTTSTFLSTATMADRQPVIAQAAPATVAAKTTPPTTILTGLLATVGLSPLANDNPLAPVESPIGWALLAWTRRQNAQTALKQAPTPVANPMQNSLAAATAAPINAMTTTSSAVTTTAAAVLQAPAVQSPPASLTQILQYTFFNKPPTASPAADCPDCLTGNLNARGPNGAPLTYTVTQPSQGSVVVNQDGTYTYTPNTDPANNVGTDSFTVTIDDGKAYRLTGVPGAIQGVLHALAQAIGLSGPDTKTVKVTVNVSGVQPPPGFTVSTLVSGLDQPTDFRFLPDGRILIAQKDGTIQVANASGELQSTPLITLPTDSTGTRGLLGIAVDPNYGQPRATTMFMRYVPCQRLRGQHLRRVIAHNGN